MKRMNLVISILLATFVLYQGAAYAKLVGGKVVSTDATAKSLTISRINLATGAEENVVVGVTDTTTYSGVASLADLKAGEEVWVDATEDATTKAWTASSVQVLKAEAPAVPAAPATTATQ